MNKPFIFAFVLVLLATPPAAAYAVEASSGRFLHEVVASSPAHQKSLRELLRGARSLPPWVRNMVSTPRYVAGALRALSVDGKPMELFAACLPRHCDDSRVRVLFTPDGKAVGMRVEDGKLGIVVFGDVTDAVRNALSTPGL
jgi:hypothetical protein